MSDEVILTIGNSKNGDVERKIIKNEGENNYTWYSVESEEITDRQWLIDDLCNEIGRLAQRVQEFENTIKDYLKKPSFEGRDSMRAILNVEDEK